MPELALLIAGAYVAMALIMLRRPAATPDGPDAPIVILRPCEGREPDLRLDPDGPGYATILCTADPASPAAARARSLRLRVAGDDARTAGWSSRKARHLDAGLARADAELPDADVVVFADADAELDPAHVTALARAARADGVVAAFAPPTAEDLPDPGNRLLRAALSGSCYAWPALTALTAALGQAPPMSGALVALRRAALPDLSCAAHAIGDDLAIAERLAASGRVVMVETPVVCLHGPIDVDRARAILRRWVYVACAHAPWRLLGYPLVFAAGPGLVAAAAIGAAFDPKVLPAGALALSVRVVTARELHRRLLGSPGSLADLARVELLLLDAAARATVALLRGEALRWRGRSYRVAIGGQILSVEEEEP